MYDPKNLSESVIMPREDFIELSTVAFDNHHVPSASERVGTTLQTTAVFAGIAAAVTAGSWGWAKAITWREKKQHERELAKLQFEIDNNLKP